MKLEAFYAFSLTQFLTGFLIFSSNTSHRPTTYVTIVLDDRCAVLV